MARLIRNYTNYFHCIRTPQPDHHSHVCLNFTHVPATLRDPELIRSDHYKEQSTSLTPRVARPSVVNFLYKILIPAIRCQKYRVKMFNLIGWSKLYLRGNVCVTKSLMTM